MSGAFQHRQAAHCESGVISSMLSHYGLPMSEPMAFGLSASLAFAYIPFIKLSGLPLISYRMPPRSVIKGLQKRLGVRMHFERFRQPERGMQALDDLLQQQRLVGLQTSVYWLPYFPEDMRFHFNAHNLMVCAREGEGYRISDPLFESLVYADRASLQKARFAKGALAAKGLLYYPRSVPTDIDYARAIPAAIRANRQRMCGAPMPIIGIRGIRHLARHIVKLAAGGRDPRYLKLYLGHVVRMQEEIGTGGAGFRFIYASFLQESARLLGRDQLAEASERMTEVGDRWRQFALTAVRMSKRREALDAPMLSQMLNDCADRESAVWDLLAKG